MIKKHVITETATRMSLVSRRGLAFTLIELLSVIVILAVLTAILFPVFSKSRMSAKVGAAKTQMRGIWLGLKLYQEENGGEAFTFTTWEEENLPPTNVNEIRRLKLIPEETDRHSPCGLMPGYWAGFDGVFYAHWTTGESDQKNIRDNRERTILSIDPQCNTAVANPKNQFWNKRAIGVTYDGVVLDRYSDQWQFTQPAFFGNQGH